MPPDICIVVVRSPCFSTLLFGSSHSILPMKLYQLPSLWCNCSWDVPGIAGKPGPRKRKGPMRQPHHSSQEKTGWHAQCEPQVSAKNEAETFSHWSFQQKKEGWKNGQRDGKTVSLLQLWPGLLFKILNSHNSPKSGLSFF